MTDAAAESCVVDDGSLVLQDDEETDMKVSRLHAYNEVDHQGVSHSCTMRRRDGQLWMSHFRSKCSDHSERRKIWT